MKRFHLTQSVLVRIGRGRDFVASTISEETTEDERMSRVLKVTQDKSHFPWRPTIYKPRSPDGSIVNQIRGDSCQLSGEDLSFHRLAHVNDIATIRFRY